MPQTPTAFEQLLMEYTNRARMRPEEEFDALIADADSVTGVQANITSAIRYFGVDMDALRAQFDGLEAVAPLAWNTNLANAADAHTQQMIIHDIQTHQAPGEAGLGDRARDAGYNFSRLGENVYAFTQDALHGHAGFFIDWGFDDEDFSNGTRLSNWQSLGDGIQDPAGHRISIMNADFVEVGMSAIDDSADDATDQVGPYAVTQNFGNRFDYEAQLLGVVIDDQDGDRFYDIGEGLGGLTVTATGSPGTFVTTTWAAGGYQMVLPDGMYTVTISGDALDGEITFSVTMAGENIKHDGFAADAVNPTPPVQTGGAGDDLLTGTDQDDVLTGAGGADTLRGEGGDDRLYGDVLPIFGAVAIAEQVFRLYQTTLDRVPDGPGYQTWTERLFEGAQALADVAAGFVASGEFQAAYGALDDAGFVALMYQNVLGRDASAGEITSWADRLANGESRADVVLGFSESAEFRLATQGTARMAAEEATAKRLAACSI